MNRYPFLLLVIVLVFPVSAQVDRNEQPTVPQGPVMNDAYQGGWQFSTMQQNADVWKRIAADDPDNAMNQLNNFRSYRNAALVRNQGSLNAQDERELEAIAADMDRTVPNSFETYMANYYLQFPGKASFDALGKAHALSPDRSELIGPQLVNAVRTGSTDKMKEWSVALKERGEVAAGLWLLADDILHSVDKNGVLIAAGEMDAYPVWAKQFAEARRTDVLVIDIRLLEDAAYRQRSWVEAKAKGPVPGDADRFLVQLAATCQRPLFLSMALGPERVRVLEDRLHVSGITLRVGDPTPDQIAVLEQQWRTMNKALNAGPLSRNYLVPGAVLLKHYRMIGDEERAARMEHELRTMAKVLGETDRLYRTGLLQH